MSDVYAFTPVYVVTPGADAYAATPVRLITPVTGYEGTPVREVDPAVVGVYGGMPVYLSDRADALPVWTAGGTLGAEGGAVLLANEANGFATDFTYTTDAKRVSTKVNNSTSYFAINAFFSNSGTSPKQVYDATGTLVWSPHNMVLQSETLDNASWTKNRVTVTANATLAPNGASTADHVLEDNTASNSHRLQQAITTITGATYTLTAYFKAGGRDYGVLVNGSAFIVVNLTNGSIITDSGSVVGSASVTSVGNGWYKCSVAFVAAGTTTTIRTDPNIDGVTFTYDGDPTKGVYVWGAQLNRGTVPTAYLATTTAARFGLAIDYNPSTLQSRGLLVEPAATNLLLRSSEFDNASWTKSAVTVSPDATTAPNGRATADKIVLDATTGAHYVGQVVASTTGVASVFAKAGELSKLLVYDSTNAVGYGFDLAAGTTSVVTTITPTASATIENIGGGWFRCSIPVTATAFVRLYPLTSFASSSASASGQGLYLSDAQLETGSVATSPILTFGATVTRAADVPSFLLSAIPALGSEWSVYLDFDTTDVTNTRYVFSATDGTSSEIAGIRISTAMNLIVTDGGANQVSLSPVSPTLSVGVRMQTSARYRANDFAISSNGAAVSTDTSGTMPAPDRVHLASINGVQHPAGQTRIRRLAIVPRGVSDADLPNWRYAA